MVGYRAVFWRQYRRDPSALMTGRNPNVFYEVGYAHALGKIVLLLTQNGDDIPFDLKHRPTQFMADRSIPFGRNLFPNCHAAVFCL
jgi:hypothetical protein